MNIECKLGSLTFFNDDDVEKIIRKCSSSPDDIWVYGENQYPCLAIPINGEKAVVHYFTSEGGSHYQSIGDMNTNGTTAFNINGDTWEAPNDVVVSLSLAIECVKQFLKTQERPSCIGWDEI